MPRHERLLAMLRSKAVDRPPVSFYQLGCLDEKPSDPNPFSIYSDPSWQPLLAVIRNHTDRIVMRGISFKNVLPEFIDMVS